MSEFIDNTAYIEIPGGIDLRSTFECGQAFRWRAVGPGVYEGVAGKRRARIAETDAGISITPCGEALYEGFWRHYLDLDCDYAACAGELARHEVLAPMVSRCAGMRILRQPVWECLVSFILSSNNNVKRISGIIGRICECFGEDMGGYFAFPAPERLAEAGVGGISACGAGYRAAFVFQAAEAVTGDFDIDQLPQTGYEAAKRKLMTLNGVGEKVADCVLLYACGYREAFPVDVWVKRAMEKYFPEAGATNKSIGEFAQSEFGEQAGLAQQYLFHYERTSDRI
jgi:N-glycosylase/DNA lyase